MLLALRVYGGYDTHQGKTLKQNRTTTQVKGQLFVLYLI